MDKPFKQSGEADARSVRQRASDASARRVVHPGLGGATASAGCSATAPTGTSPASARLGPADPGLLQRTGAVLLTPESVRAVAKRSAEHGSDAWFTQEPAELLGPDFASAGLRGRKTPQGAGHLRRLVRVRLVVERRAPRPRLPEVPRRPLPRRLRPAPRLVPALAPAVAGRDGPSPVQAGVDARLHREAGRHEGQQERQGIRDRDAGGRARRRRAAPSGAAASTTRATSPRRPL